MAQAISPPALNRPRRRPSRPTVSVPLLLSVAIALAISMGLAIAVDPKYAYLGAVAVVGPVAIFYIVSSPALATCVALAAHTWGMELSGQYVTPFKIFGVLAILVVGTDIARRRRLHPVPRLYSYGVALLLVLVAVGELLAEFEGSMGPFFEFGGTLVIFGLLTQTIVTPADLRTLTRVYVVNLVLTVVSVWLEVGWSALGESGMRAGGICGHPNALGNHLAMSLPFALALLTDRNEGWAWRTTALFAALGSAYGEWGAASRGGTIGFLVALFAFALLAPRRNALRGLAFAAAVATAAGFSSFAPHSFDRVTETLDAGTDLDAAASERSLHARIAADMLPRHPFLGAGVTAFGYDRSRYSGTLGGALHSSVLAVGVAYGLPALLLYVLLQFSGVIAMVRHFGTGPDRVYHAALACGALAAITSSLSGTELFRAEQWSVIGLCHIATLRTTVAEAARERGKSGT